MQKPIPCMFDIRRLALGVRGLGKQVGRKMQMSEKQHRMKAGVSVSGRRNSSSHNMTRLRRASNSWGIGRLAAKMPTWAERATLRSSPAGPRASISRDTSRTRQLIAYTLLAVPAEHPEVS